MLGFLRCEVQGMSSVRLIPLASALSLFKTRIKIFVLRFNKITYKTFVFCLFMETEKTDQYGNGVSFCLIQILSWLLYYCNSFSYKLLEIPFNNLSLQYFSNIYGRGRVTTIRSSVMICALFEGSLCFLPIISYWMT